MKPFAVLGAVCALVIGVYAWSAKSGTAESGGSKAENTYYNLLVKGFRVGQLDLKKEMPAGLAQLLDSHDSVANNCYWLMEQQLLDLSYYQGKLYLYFGLTPALMLFWPYVAVTGHYLLDQDAAVFFFSAGFLVSVGLLWLVWRRCFAKVSVGVVATGALALGLANFTLACLQRGGVYEVAISCGYAWTMVTLTLVWQAMHARRRRVWWLVGASLAYGLAVGARPSLLFGAVILLVPVVMIWRERVAMVQRPPAWTLWLATTGPITVIGLGLLLYNFLRFDDPLEFGQRYQLPLSWHQQFSLHFLWFNFWVGFLEPARWSLHFPFVHDIALPPLPTGANAEQLPFGVLTNIPVVWLALTVPLAWRSRLGEGRSFLRWLVVAVSLLFGTSALIILLHDSMCLRYQVEFSCSLILLAVIGVLGLEHALADRPGRRLAARCGWGLLLAFSVFFNLFAMVQRSSQSYVCHGVISFHRGQTDQAIVLYQKALKWQPDNAEAHTSLGAALFEQGKVSAAIEHLEEAIRLKPDSATAHANMGFALLRQGKVPEAIGPLEEALRLNPKHTEAYDALGEALLRLGEGLTVQGKLDETVQQYQRALRMNADNVQFHDSLGRALSRRGRYPEAVLHFRRAVELDPQLVSALNNLAWILATETNGAIRNVGEAVQCAERACALTTNAVAIYLDTLGVAYSEAGRFSEAVEASERGAARARAVGNQDLAVLIEGRLKHYREGRPYHAIAEGAGP